VSTSARFAAAWPGFAPVVLLLPCAALAQGVSAPPPRQTAPPPAVIAAPGQLASAKLLASMITAIDHANKTGNYTVLHAMGSTGFQANTSPASLGAAFAVFRQQRIDLSDVLVLSPNYETAPSVVAPGLVRMRGRYALARGALGFDLQFRWDRGWRLDSVSLRPPAASPTPRPTLRPAR
jgi:hypothetical protein